MFDDVDIDKLPYGAKAYAGYVNGMWPNAGAIMARFPHESVIFISVNASNVGDCLDIECGDATIDQAPRWWRGRVGRTRTPKPVLYTSASQVAALIVTMQHAGIKRDRYFVFSAHYTGQPHICAPRVCGYPQADATQWTDRAYGRSLDESLIQDYVLPGYKPARPKAVPPPPPAPKPDPTVTHIVNELNAAARKVPSHSPTWWRFRNSILALLGRK
jgi:hypothetical protein